MQTFLNVSNEILVWYPSHASFVKNDDTLTKGFCEFLQTNGREKEKVEYITAQRFALTHKSKKLPNSSLLIFHYQNYSKCFSLFKMFLSEHRKATSKTFDK